MLEPIYTTRFKKQFKLLQKCGMDMIKLREVMDLIINEEPLLPKHCNHPLHGKWKGKWGCHIEPDWVLIYRVEKTSNEIMFYRTGSHSDLY